MPKKGTLYTVSAPSGAGKTSLVNALLKKTSGLHASVSHTTRAMRPGEKEGVDYYFVNQAAFLSLVDEQAFLEHAQVFNHFYGTSQKWVQQTLLSGADVILEIDWQGAAQIRRLLSDCISIFVLPPSLNALEERLTSRGQDASAVIKRRLSAAKEEISHFKEADYLIINDGFSEALDDIGSIILSKRLKLPRQEQKYLSLLKDLLS
ncbi:MAG: guanylate kinase [Porticoccus sp.]|jgi:guanylate kinase|uniref:guanylate kinase n=1 Tax=Porticoccus sp. Uisw_050_02 TaxID=3230978 RepID=UPI00309F10C9|tara:strand:+ start:9435 stop:10052 length:618 start_codon:yes stop_codon:yes gene_type:complete